MLLFRILFVFILAISVFPVNGQEIIRSTIGSAGSTAFNNGILVRQTIGQPPGTVVLEGETVILRQGFQQAIDHHSVTSAPLIPADLAGDVTDFAMFPNPARDYVEIILADGTLPFDLFMYNMHGKQIYHLTNIGDTRITVNLQSLVPGIYFVTVSNSGGRSSQRLMIF